MQPDKIRELKIMLAYFSACAVTGYGASLLHPLKPVEGLVKPSFMPPKIFITYMNAPDWLKYALAVFFISFTAISIYSRINLKAGRVIFSRIPPERLRKDSKHIFRYTVIPIFFTACYLLLFLRCL